MAGFKYNMTDLAAALGLEQLKKLEARTVRRSEIAKAYSTGLAQMHGICLPQVAPRSTHAWHLYLIRFDAERTGFTRDRVHEHLRSLGIGTSVHFIPLHQLTLFKEIARGTY